LSAPTDQTPLLRTNGARLLAHLAEMAEIGATPAGGCNRQALTDLDRDGRLLFLSWCEARGYAVTVDRIGNLFAQRPGTDPDARPILMGSHLDTQPTGGKYDGVYGVLAGLEVLEALDDAGVDLPNPLEVAVWTNEEGARFDPAMTGSGVWSGVLPLEGALRTRDADGITLGDELLRLGFSGMAPAEARPLRAALEVHIEQGPILEANGLPLGIVTGGQGIRWYDIVVQGTAVHAGPTPMEQRHDPVLGLAEVVSELRRLAEAHAPWARVTVAKLSSEPAARNTVPAVVRASLDLRHPDDATLDALDAGARATLAAAAERHGLVCSLHEAWRSAPVAFDAEIVDAFRHGATVLGAPHQDIISGAGHDSCYLARVTPTGMLFIPCRGGVSHNESEHAEPEHLVLGADALLQAVLRLAGSSAS
jgi:beta-ureidopropionase / N-carbamoyl-L-amino-acid hydrolase